MSLVSMRSAILGFLFLGVVLTHAQEWHNGPTPQQFMTDYARLLLAHDREALIRLYSPAGALILGDTIDDHASPEQIAEIYRTAWHGPKQFAWRDLSFRQLSPDVCLVSGGFDWTSADAPKAARYHYHALLVRLDGRWRLRSEVEIPVAEADAVTETPKPAKEANDAPRAAFELPPINTEVPLSKIKEICAHYGLPALWAKIEKDLPARPFKSDGCTGWFDDWKGVSLYPAGFLHDLKYWAGYPGEDVERLVADAELMIDVAKLLKSTTMAETMFHGVRVGGTEQLQASFSWGFGRRP